MTSSVPHEEGTRPFGKHNDDCGSCCCCSVDTDHLRAEVSRLTTERDEARAKIDKAADLVAGLVRADNNRTGLGPDGRITGADTLPLQMLLGLSLTLREGFARPPSEGKEST